MSKDNHIQNLNIRNSKYNYEKFLRLARNSLNAGKYTLAADNCRLAVQYSLAQKNHAAMAEAYEIWIESLFGRKRYHEIKKICYQARTHFGNSPDLLYYEYKASLESGDKASALRLARQFVEMAGSGNQKLPDFLKKSLGHLSEVQQTIERLGTKPALNRPS